jgi:hypothetical protein
MSHDAGQWNDRPAASLHYTLECREVCVFWTASIVHLPGNRALDATESDDLSKWSVEL